MAVTYLPANDFAPWLSGAQPGSSTVYFSGDLTYTRYRGGTGYRPSTTTPTPEAREIELTACMAYGEQRTGRIALTQRRVGPNHWDYIATRTAR